MAAGVYFAEGYILLTANVEDVQQVARQLADSPVVDQLARIWRRASQQFSQHVVSGAGAGHGYRKRSGTDHVSSGTEEFPAGPRDDASNEELTALGKNASVYLKSIRRLLQNLSQRDSTP